MADQLDSLASEYGLRLVYRKAFNEILSEEKDTRDFGPLLGKMGVINPEGVSNMDEDQWEAASTSNLPPPGYPQSTWLIDRFVHGFCSGKVHVGTQELYISHHI